MAARSGPPFRATSPDAGEQRSVGEQSTPTREHNQQSPAREPLQQHYQSFATPHFSPSATGPKSSALARRIPSLSAGFKGKQRAIGRFFSESHRTMPDEEPTSPRSADPSSSSTSQYGALSFGRPAAPPRRAQSASRAASVPLPSPSADDLSYTRRMLEQAQTPKDDSSDPLRSSQISTASSRSLTARLSELQLVNLNLAILAAQLSWSIELGYGTPFLLSLGLSKQLTALVWLAGPLGGLIVQPLVGAYSDRSQSRFRRRAFILASYALIVISTLFLAFSGEIARWLIDLFGFGVGDWDPALGEHLLSVARWVAVPAFYVLDFALNGLQASARSLILDRAPSRQQGNANAWHSRMTQIGNVAGYALGFTNLQRAPVFRWLGGSQFRKLCIISLVLGGLCILVTCVTQPEIPAKPETDDKDDKSEHARRGIFRQFQHSLIEVWDAIVMLPVPIRKLCSVQFAAWSGWFPFLFYASTYVAQSWKNDHLHHSSGESDEEAGRAGALALLFFALVAAGTGAMLPPLLAAARGAALSKRRMPFLLRYSLASATLKNAWTASHLLFSLLMLITVFVDSARGATTLVALIGVPWAITCWVPFAYLMAYIREIKETFKAEPSVSTPTQGHARSGSDQSGVLDYRARTRAALDECQPLLEPRHRHARQQSYTGATSTAQETGGVMIGIMNLSIVLPQLVVAVVSSIIFKLVELGEGDNETSRRLTPAKQSKDVVWVFLYGSVMTLLAARWSRQVVLTNEETDFLDALQTAHDESWTPTDEDA
ncbi:uncharacterized protein L969DRAFT_82752 [Mixia osmundae IAM 14324]|uniref:Major facilitator superfamily (MFS) profile domain-containing protein n=1 Tax=Mixia osmundae (strain CBS 9802 / IAM 14324 / JCM 22182 / KY 12970) TaxID=764103 RepID=G7E811_MIXOS|nr:uncharacterized protein L969DRAFT_82752 [Mixia osmundae IAM 14324]KEI38570.1 hypothetical protein L969DRAFT_82752 [Mixia osmundae IAM 14324]GAA98971.1 hypothetical protein E5Q_05659 [Mixia osmundae IAM 14324]